MITGAVLLAAVLHASWNALTHAITDKLVASMMLSLGFLVCGALAIPLVGIPAVESWPFLLASAVVVHGLYTVALMRAYRLGAFNQVYPLARGMSPWVVALIATVFLGEQMTVLQTVGVVVVSLGLGSLVFARGRPHVEEVPAVLAAVATGLLIAAYTLLDGVGVRRSGDPLAYAAWLFLLHGGTFLAYGFVRRGRALTSDIRRHWRLGAAAGISATAAYGLVLWAQSRGSLATVAALRESSVIVGAIIGALIFEEPFGRWRTLSTVVVASGIALLNLG